ncbi:MAG: hypothetical protein CMJ82_00850 [Planctomycetaceae bacterium]|nr:hypothetical protein [Planctomycetaceae bacterium]
MNCKIQADNNPARRLRKHSARGGFTLIELLLAVTIVSMLAAMITVGMSTLRRQAQIRRCEQQVKKIDELIQTRFNELINKPLPVQFPTLPQLSPNPTPMEINLVTIRKQQIMTCRRELLRMEMPDRITDVTDPHFIFTDTFNNSFSMLTPSSHSAFRRKVTLNNSMGNTWTEEHQGSECLYLMLSIMRDQDSNALDFLFPSEIGDTDGDGMLEVLDAFGTPLGFLRWAPGISGRPGSTDRNYSGIQTTDYKEAPDWTDIGGADPRYRDDDLDDNSTLYNNPFHLHPLICSAGPDEEFGMFGLIRRSAPGANGTLTNSHPDAINAQQEGGIDAASQSGFHYRATAPIPYDPFFLHTVTNPQGIRMQFGTFVHSGMIDNISNHDIEEAP